MWGVMRRAVGVLPSRSGIVVYPAQRLSELLSARGGIGHSLLVSCVCVNICLLLSLLFVVQWRYSYGGEVQGYA